MDRTRKQARANKDAQMEVAVLEKLSATLNEGKSVRQLSLTEEEAETIKDWDCSPVNRSSTRLMYLRMNWQLGMSGAGTIANQENAQVVVVSAQVESELVELPEKTELTSWHLWAWKKAG